MKELIFTQVTSCTGQLSSRTKESKYEHDLLILKDFEETATELTMQ